jgi:hypothetical protein
MGLAIYRFITKIAVALVVLSLASAFFISFGLALFSVFNVDITSKYFSYYVLAVALIGFFYIWLGNGFALFNAFLERAYEYFGLNNYKK